MKLEYLETDNSNVGACFINCVQQVKDKGGKVVYGWLIETNKLRQSVHHAVRQDPDRKMWDITPQPSSCSDGCGKDIGMTLDVSGCEFAREDACGSRGQVGERLSPPNEDMG